MTHWFRPTEGSLLQRLIASRQHHPDAFDCGVRVRHGELTGESSHWRYRLSAVDPLSGADGSLTFTHGRAAPATIRVDATSVGRNATRPSEVSFLAVEQRSRATLEISVHGDHLHRFGVGLP